MTNGEYIDLFVKWLVAFFMPIGWAIILYPLAKRLRKSWLILLIFANILSFLLFVAKEAFDEITPGIDKFTVYIVGLFFGSALLSLLFNFISRWLQVLPAKDTMILREENTGRHVHLRQIFQIAIMLEERGRDFYQGLARTAVNPDVQKLCRDIAQDEIIHKKIIEDTLFPWLPLPFAKESLDMFEQKLKLRGIYLNPPPPDSTEEEMILYAIEQEKQMTDFYLSFERAFPEAWKKTRVQMLAMEERSHESKLLIAYSAMKK